ncbi:hypothetical protein SODALDRAFT_358445 [Sodiomyces alkalinus F11]|uniref:Uncharacterized protein n=1 Tax=Sodiomyces alkalinus (strain CBS 110278 / VKM F-3762 / F11) TaxID=1314773 RepID=A0A3N2PZR9_SODAK|nr:hypothetical protein SODALDRAFT_358445 [Sodiomyces alkalinus F11]ROT40021.1 hypothetical protein SODALDRAFT_358445 [Sodiomyces alkalinus F11]
MLLHIDMHLGLCQPEQNSSAHSVAWEEMVSVALVPALFTQLPPLAELCGVIVNPDQHQFGGNPEPEHGSPGLCKDVNYALDLLLEQGNAPRQHHPFCIPSSVESCFKLDALSNPALVTNAQPTRTGTRIISQPLGHQLVVLMPRWNQWKEANNFSFWLQNAFLIPSQKLREQVYARSTGQQKNDDQSNV